MVQVKKLHMHAHIVMANGYEHRRVKLDIKIPAGIQSGQQIRIPRKRRKRIKRRT